MAKKKKKAAEEAVEKPLIEKVEVQKEEKKDNGVRTIVSSRG